MRSIRKHWPGRLLAAVLALAMIAASGIGAFAHAAGHHHHDGHHGGHHGGDGHAVEAADVPTPVMHKHAAAGDSACHKHQHGSGTGTGDSTGGHADCCDLMCHGWTALVGAKFALPVPLRPAAGIVLVRTAAGVWPTSLDRPPRPRVLA